MGVCHDGISTKYLEYGKWRLLAVNIVLGGIENITEADLWNRRRRPTALSWTWLNMVTTLAALYISKC